VSRDNMGIWTRCEQPPASVLKPIQAGRLKGKSDINPQWRYRVMTEMFGAAGVGWWYSVRERWTETVGQEVLCFILVDLYVAGHDHPVQGIGGNKIADMESRGLYANDEGWKMALTDALSVAMKTLGVGAAVYEGRWDGSKYADRQDAANSPVTPTTPTAAIPTGTKMIVRTCAVEKTGVGKMTGKPYTLYRLSGDVDGQDTTLTTFADCAGIAAGDTVSLDGVTTDERGGGLKARGVTRV